MLSPGMTRLGEPAADGAEGADRPKDSATRPPRSNRAQAPSGSPADAHGRESERQTSQPPQTVRLQVTNPGAVGGIGMSVPAGSALPNASAIRRAIRPLKRRYPSRTRRVIDEAATVRASAEEKLLHVVERP